MIANLFQYSMFAGILLGICFLVQTNLSSKRNDKSIIYLNLFVFFLTANNLQITLFDYGYVECNFFVRKLLIPWYCLIMPAFYTFITHYLRVQEKIVSLVYFSCILFGFQILARLAMIPFFFYEPNSYVVAKYAQIEEIVNACITFFIFGKIIFIFYKQSKLYAYIASYDDMKWLRQFLLIGGLILLLWVMAIVINIHEVMNPSVPVYYPLRFSSTLLLYWIAYKGFFHYNLMTERMQLRAEISKENLPLVSSFENSTDEKFLFLQNYILNNHKYTIVDYRLEDLAQEIKISSRIVSQILKKNTNLNFTDYINSLRVQKAEKLLLNPSYSDYTIISIGLECGFNSKSTFYRAFTKFNNTTPTEYRAKNQA